MIRSLMALALRERIVVIGIALMLLLAGIFFVLAVGYRGLSGSGAAADRNSGAAQRSERGRS